MEKSVFKTLLNKFEIKAKNITDRMQSVFLKKNVSILVNVSINIFKRTRYLHGTYQMSYFGSQTDLSVVRAREGIFHYLYFSGIVTVIIIVYDCVCSSFAI